MRIGRRVPTRSAALLFVLVLVSCQGSPGTTGGQSPSAPASTDATVTMLIPTFGNELFDPYTAANNNIHFMRFFAAALIQGDGKGGMAPGVFSSWENSSDAKTWTFTLRSGVKAHNGEEITLDNVLWNLESRFGELGKSRAKAGEKVNSSLVALQNITKKISKAPPDKIVVELTVSRPDLPFLWSSNFPDAEGYVIPAQYFQQVGPDGFQKAPIGTGPFKLVSFTPGSEMVFERFDDYYYQPKYGLKEDRRPQFKKLVLRAVPEPSTRISALQAGQADIIAASPQMVPEIKRAGGSVAYAEEAVFPELRYIGCWDPSLWCYKKEVRQALEVAIDKQNLLDKLYGREAGAVKGWTVVTPSALGYVAGVTDPLPYNVDKAKSLLAQAGYADGKGLPSISIRIYDNGLAPFLPEVAQVFADSWKRIGIEAVIQAGDPDTVFAKYNDGGFAGDVLVRALTTRWLGSDFAIVTYADDARKQPLCKPSAAACAPLAKIVNEKMRAVQPDVPSMNKAFGEAYTVLRDATYGWTPFYLHQPWGLGPRIAEYRPWPMNASNTAEWTIKVK